MDDFEAIDLSDLRDAMERGEPPQRSPEFHARVEAFLRLPPWTETVDAWAERLAAEAAEMAD